MKTYYEQLDEYLSNTKFNGAISIQHIDSEKPLFSKEYGVANALENIKPNTVFAIASLSKQFTAVAIMLLYEAGKISLSDPIGKYLAKDSVPESWDWIKSTSVLQLLEHKSGLPDDLYDSFNCSETIDKVQNKPMREHYHDKHNTNIQPSKENIGSYNYSNLGYSLLALLVEDVSGQSFHSFLKENIFDRHHMPNTFVGEHSYHHENIKTHPEYHFADPHVAKIDALNPTIIADPNNLNISQGGNIKSYGDDRIYSTCSDLIQWWKSLYTGKIVSLETLDTILGNRREDYSNSYGIEFDHIRNHTVYGHSGMTLGVAADLKFIKEANMIIVLLSNVTADYLETIRLFENKPDSFIETNNQTRDIVIESILSLGPSLAFTAAREILEITFTFEDTVLNMSAFPGKDDAMIDSFYTNNTEIDSHNEIFTPS